MRTFHFAAVLYLLSAQTARIAFTLGVVEGFFDYNLIPETRTYLDGTLNISEGPRCALTKENRGNRPQRFRLRVPKSCFVSERDAICYRPSVCLSSVSVCLSPVTLVHPTQAVKFSAIFLRHLIRCPSVDIHRKFYGDRPMYYCMHV